MPGSSIGKLFRVSTWGESHGKALGVLIDGCPPGIFLSEIDIQKELDKRKPGQTCGTKRVETDKAEILSGVFEGKTTGTPISIIVWNKDARPSDYSKIKDIYRPGHADLVYEQKYGFRDYRGGGRASGRETVARVMAGAVALKILEKKKIAIIGHTVQIGSVRAEKFNTTEIKNNEFKCADKVAAGKMLSLIERIKKENDSIGGIFEIIVKNVPVGLGDPVFEKLDAELSKAIMSIGGVKGVSFGAGFDTATMKGSENNDKYKLKNGKIKTLSNHAGGILGGISTGEDIILRAAVKAPASIGRNQKSINSHGKLVEFKIEGRHDVCIVPRVITVAENMVAMVLADYLLRQNSIKKIQ